MIRSGSTGCSTASPPYHFITAIEGCAQIAHHVIASEGWRVAESNADAVRAPGVQRVVPGPTAEAVARAVGFHHVLVHEYTDGDDGRVRDNLQPPCFTGVGDTPSVISVQMGRGAPEQAECDVSMTAIWLGQVHLFRARYFMGRWPGTRRR